MGEVSTVWDPLLEANPYKARSALRSTRRRAKLTAVPQAGLEYQAATGLDSAAMEAAMAPPSVAAATMTRERKRKKAMQSEGSIAACSANIFAQEAKRLRGSIAVQVGRASASMETKMKNEEAKK